MTVAHRTIILASSSPYRRELFDRLGLSYFAVSPEVDESPLPGEAPRELAIRLSRAKAEAVHCKFPDSITIGSDQVAALDGAPVGKPGSARAAREQLRALSGKTVVFHTALTVLSPDSEQSAEVPTICVFRPLTDTAIARYVAIDTPWDTAGSAKAERLGIALMRSIRSDDPTAIIGLPLITLTGMLSSLGIDPLDYARMPA